MTFYFCRARIVPVELSSVVKHNSSGLWSKVRRTTSSLRFGTSCKLGFSTRSLTMLLGWVRELAADWSSHRRLFNSCISLGLRILLVVAIVVVVVASPSAKCTVLPVSSVGISSSFLPTSWWGLELDGVLHHLQLSW